MINNRYDNRYERARQIFMESGELANIITTYINDKSKVKNYGTSVIAYAVEMILFSLAKSVDENIYDNLSEEWRKKLQDAHEDIKVIDSFSK